ncbi:ferredoxin-type protein NapF [Flexibacterium corallicola]|uniref:ferredoxin-type protein NapF n=1 Tax=Flexibacterium corallicola TaxID=3037259 RepID=UPI0038621E09
MHRRQFLSAFLRTDEGLRPPYWAGPANSKLDCNSCGDCIPACPERILFSAEDGRPSIDFQAGACTFCGACVEACKTDALSQQIDPQKAYRVQINPSCLSYLGVSCRSCADFCEHGAIRFSLAPSGRHIPVLDAHVCTGCGACVSSCPSTSIEITQSKRPGGAP